MNSTKVITISEDFNRFTPELSGMRQVFFTGTITIVSGVAMLFQRAIYKALKRLGSRSINQMIVPSQVSFSCLQVSEGTLIIHPFPDHFQRGDTFQTLEFVWQSVSLSFKGGHRHLVLLC